MARWNFPLGRLDRPLQFLSWVSAQASTRQVRCSAGCPGGRTLPCPGHSAGSHSCWLNWGQTGWTLLCHRHSWWCLLILFYLVTSGRPSAPEPSLQEHRAGWAGFAKGSTSEGWHLHVTIVSYWEHQPDWSRLNPPSVPLPHWPVPRGGQGFWMKPWLLYNHCRTLSSVHTYHGNTWNM